MFQNLKDSWSYNANEKALLNSYLKSGKVSDKSIKTPAKKIVIQTPVDYYILALYSQVILKFLQKDEDQVIGLWPNIFLLKQRRDFLYPLRIVYSYVNAFFIRRKWVKLYASIGVNSFSYLKIYGLSKKIKLLTRAFQLWRGLRSKKDLIDLSIDGIYCGDLIYDTYLRYRIKPTVAIKDIALLYFIYKCLCVIDKTETLAKENIITDYFSSYSTYIHHGIPVRVFLKHGINVYTSGNLQQRFKKLSQSDYYHTASHKLYNEQFKTLDNRTEKTSNGLSLLKKKFEGKIDMSTSYMKKSAYQNHSEQPGGTDFNFDGIVFLHDFYDSPHIYSNMLFCDFYEWVEYTLSLIVKHNLKIGVKPHPNQVIDSKKDIETLQRRFASIHWIDPNTSNLKIINSGIRFGISIYGTILHELAYHNINPICAGENPHTSFNFIHIPENLEQYDSLILNNQNLKLPDNYLEQVGQFYYMHNLHPKDDFQVDESIFKNYSFLNGSSELLKSITNR